MSYNLLTQWDSPNYTSARNDWIKVDDEDKGLLEKYTWSLSDGYAKRYYEQSKDGKRVRGVKYLHRVIAKAKAKEVVDHINGDRSDNRRSNLRLVNKSINALNTEKTKGVCYSKNNKRWYARLTVNGLTKSLGGFSDFEGANRAYLNAKKEVLSVV